MVSLADLEWVTESGVAFPYAIILRDDGTHIDIRKAAEPDKYTIFLEYGPKVIHTASYSIAKWNGLSAFEAQCLLFRLQQDDISELTNAAQ